jgi:hypothetical protein
MWQGIISISQFGFHIPINFEVVLKSSIAGDSKKQSLQVEYIIIQSI